MPTEKVMKLVQSRTYESRNTILNWFDVIRIYRSDLPVIYSAMTEKGISIKRGTWMNNDSSECGTGHHFGDLQTEKEVMKFCMGGYTHEYYPSIDFVDFHVRIGEAAYIVGFNFSKDEIYVNRDIEDPYNIESILEDIVLLIDQEHKRCKP